MVDQKNIIKNSGALILTCALLAFSAPALATDGTEEKVNEATKAIVATSTAIETITEVSEEIPTLEPETTIVSEAQHIAVQQTPVKKEAGLPQFDFSTFPSQIFWLFVFFATIYIYTSGKALPAISGTIENRRRHIQGEIENSQAMADEARIVQTQYEQKLEGARSEAGKIIAEVSRSIKDMASQTQDRFRDSFEAEIKKTEAMIEETKLEIANDLKEAAAEIVIELSDKVSGTAIKKNKALQAIEGDEVTASAKAA